MKDTIRYSKAFKLKVLEEIRDGKWKTIRAAKAAYGITGGATISLWMDKYGFGHLKGRVVCVKNRNEIDEIRRLKQENRRLRDQLADRIIDHAIDKAALDLACRNLGTTAEALKKKAGSR